MIKKNYAPFYIGVCRTDFYDSVDSDYILIGRQGTSITIYIYK